MRKFILKVVGFALAVIIPIFFLVFLPPTPRSLQAPIFAELQKDSLLKHVESPRIIFVGGSNLSFGINSQTIRDSFNINPINTAISAGLGLKYMMDHTIQYVKKEDIVVLVPEYDHFFREYEYISDELLRIVADVNHDNYRLLSAKQRFNLLSFIPKFSVSKLSPLRYFNIEVVDYQSIHSFNQYGDTYKHWGLEKKTIASTTIAGKFNPEVIQGVKKFQSDISLKGAILFVSYPSLQDISFFKSVKAIKDVEASYIQNGFTVLGTPERYMMPDSLMFDTRYHLGKKGLDYRTQLLIEDLREYLKNSHP
ncbi:MAG: hypothetical protein LBL94_12335 [Prevotellaceae bacterium]|jgi:hypothetical protein|nr:hypothetical protein [Prevotellaceae bacterium]